MQYADFMAFPFPQHKLMAGERDLVVDPGIRLDFCQITSVPPFIQKMDDIVRIHTGFVSMLGGQTGPMPSCFFGLQNPPENASVADLLTLKGLGIRFMTLAYEGVNEYGGGFAAPDEALSERGRELIRAMTETGMVLDLSHAGHRTTREALDFIWEKTLRIRVVATHTACYNLHEHGRGLPDDILRRISGLGGLVGLVTITWILHATNNDLRHFFCHLEHLIKVIGENYTCLGTDGVYTHLNPQEDRERFDIMKAKIDPRGTFRARHPEQADELNQPDRLVVIENGIRSLGWSEDRIEKIMGRNLIKYLSNL